MGYIRLFIELRSSKNRESGGQGRVEILDRPERDERRYEMKVRLSVWGLAANCRYPVALISIRSGRYRRFALGELHTGPRGRADFVFRGVYGTVAQEEPAAEHFDAVIVGGEDPELTGFRREPVSWKGLTNVEAKNRIEPNEEKAETEPLQVQAEPQPEPTAAADSEEPEAAERPLPEKPSAGETTAAEESVESEAGEEPKETVAEASAETAEAEPEEAQPVSTAAPKEPFDPAMRYLFSQYRKVFPFQDVSRRWIRIRPEDLVLLPGDLRQLQSCPFVNRACRRYGHLILGENGAEGYTLGVPYRYLPVLKEEAEQHSFHNFRSIRGMEAGYGEYGYWLRDF